MPAAAPEIEAFIARWTDAPLHERALYQSFVTQLCALIGAAAPHEHSIDPGYTFDAPIRFKHDNGDTSAGFIDCYKKGAFVLEAKQSRKAGRGESSQDQYELALQAGAAVPLKRPDPRAAAREAGFDRLMRAARNQAEGYAKALDEWPPFLVIVDVGRVIELYADFSRQGKNYAQFPDRRGFRIALADLRDEEVRTRLKAVWDEPMSLDPASARAEVTNAIAALLAQATRSIERRGPQGDRVARSAHAGKVADFLMQCLFAMFAEDVGLLPERAFQKLIEDHRGKANLFHLAAQSFFATMDTGGYSPGIQQVVRRFNGGIFHGKAVVEVTEDELTLLQLAAQRDWRNVEPAIFGTLLEQALDPKERASLGAHYTPRAYVERLVAPTVIEPLREDFNAVETAAIGEWVEGGHEAARKLVRAFHDKLCATRVLDPACGTGNFLYVALELMKRLEGKVLDLLRDLGEPNEPLNTVGPSQFYGLEKNARAAPIAELVLWIGYLQWWFRTRERGPDDPVLRDYGTIRVQDALLTYDREELLTGPDGRPITRQDPDGLKLHPITGELVPDPDARLGVYRYANPRRAKWPEAEFIVGNPPFIGKGEDMRTQLGDGYVEALWASRGRRSDSIDLVMYWWSEAARLLKQKGGKLRRFGFITTNSISQKFNRRVLAEATSSPQPVFIIFAVDDHPWYKPNKSSGKRHRRDRKAAVRIAMTVASAEQNPARLLRVRSAAALDTDNPQIEFEELLGAINTDLTIGADVTSARALRANHELSCNGNMLASEGFRVSSGHVGSLDSGLRTSLLLRPFLHGEDLNERFALEHVFDAFGWAEADLRQKEPLVWQWLRDRVWPDREHNRDAGLRRHWFVFGRPRPELRRAIAPLPRYIGTTETSKYRIFSFIPKGVIADHKIVCVASDDGFHLGVLSSKAHVTWSNASGGWMGVGNDPVYVKGDTFDPFPFPAATDAQRTTIRRLAEELDAVRKQVIAERDFLTMTRLYNVREKLVRGEELTDDGRAIYDAGRVGVIHELHRRIDVAVSEAYGWPADLSDADILTRLVGLNRERAEEEAQGLVRWLRPDYQAARFARSASRPPVQTEAELHRPIELPSLPAKPDELARALLSALQSAGRPLEAQRLAERFEGGQARAARNRVSDTLAVLAVAGQVRREGDAWFAPRYVS